MRRKDREVTDQKEIQHIFDTCKVCRLGLQDEDGVYIVPVNYGYCMENDTYILYFHGAKEGKKIDLIQKNLRAGIELDCGHELVSGATACQYSYLYGSIIGKGRAEIVEDTQEKLKALAVIMKHQTGREFDEFETNPKLEKTVAIIKVTLEECSCKKHA